MSNKKNDELKQIEESVLRNINLIKDFKEEEEFKDQIISIEGYKEKAKVPDCAICLTELRKNIVALTCGHVMHHDCFKQMKSAAYGNDECPLCKQVFREADVRTLLLDIETLEYDKENEA